MAATGAADRNAEATAAISEIRLQGRRDERCDSGLNGRPYWVGQYVCGDGRVTSISWSQLWHPVWICCRTHVKEEIRIEWDPMFVAETRQVNGTWGIAPQHLSDEPIAKLAGRKIASINDGIRDLSSGTQKISLRPNGSRNITWRIYWSPKGVSVTRLAKTSNQHIITCVEVDHATLYTDPGASGTNCINRQSRITIARINHEAESRKSLRLKLNLLEQSGKQVVGEVINRAESDVFQ